MTGPRHRAPCGAPAGRRRLVGAALAGALAVAALAACSDAGGGGDDEAAATGDTAVAETTTTTAVRSELDTPGATAEQPGISLEDDPLAVVTVPPTMPPQVGADPAIMVGGVDAQGETALALDVSRFPVAGELVPNAGNPYHEIATVDTTFMLAVELYPDAGLGWDGSTGEWPTDCDGAGICVYFDRDGDGDEPTLVAAPDGRIRIDSLAEGAYAVTLVGLRFPADGGGGYHLADVTLASTPP